MKYHMILKVIEGDRGQDPSLYWNCKYTFEIFFSVNFRIIFHLINLIKRI